MEKEQIIELLKAIIDGRMLQTRKSEYHPWVDMPVDMTKISIDTENNQYRVKPEEMYEPYSGMADFVDFGYAERSDKTVLLKNHDNVPGVIVMISVGCVDVRFFDKEKNDTVILEFSYKHLLHECNWRDDDTPCGVLIDG